MLGGSDPSTKEKAVRFLARAGLLPSIPINFTDLRGTDLSGANLSGANMSSVNLSGVNPSGATLQGDDFRDADLSGADLSGADLLFAQVNEDELAQAKSLAGATMPHGTQHPNKKTAPVRDLTGVALRGVQLRSWRAPYKGAQAGRSGSRRRSCPQGSGSPLCAVRLP